MTSVDYAEGRRDAVATYMASGPESASATWSLEGADMDDFSISSDGVLTFVRAPDYETKSTYMVTVKADDGTYMATRDVTVTVTDVDDVVSEDTLVTRYAGDDGILQKTEVLTAINDYLFGEGDAAITKTDVLGLINMYLFAGG